MGTKEKQKSDKKSVHLTFKKVKLQKRMVNQFLKILGENQQDINIIFMNFKVRIISYSRVRLSYCNFSQLGIVIQSSNHKTHQVKTRVLSQIHPYSQNNRRCFINIYVCENSYICVCAYVCIHIYVYIPTPSWKLLVFVASFLDIKSQFSL